VGRGDDGRRWRAAALALALDSREIILIIFTVEIFCKVVAEDGEPLNFLYTGALNSWNCFDLFVVLGSYGSNVRCNWGKAQTEPQTAVRTALATRAPPGQSVTRNTTPP
jgi:hypothetical protein